MKEKNKMQLNPTDFRNYIKINKKKKPRYCLYEIKKGGQRLILKLEIANYIRLKNFVTWKALLLR